ncbi:MAG: U32 family peptidase [Nanoarchaeota archaeon]
MKKLKNNLKKQYELLAPVGSFPMLISAINSGADSVYLGLKQGFGMRATAKNFTLNELKKIRKICNTQNPDKKIKIYLTLNTIIYPEEIKKIEKIIKKISKENLVDAIICWDLSVIKLCKKYNLSFHISTQASVSNNSSAEFYKKLGAERIVLARELSLKQIKKIKKQVKGIELESFIHGARCVSISGRCFTSQFLFNKSANRGKCLHPCRRTYTIKDEEGNELKLNNNRVLSAKDLCTLPFIEKMKKAGITCFKIEGRNRDARYVSKITEIYRKALDKKLSEQEIKESIEKLKKVYNRKFSSGFYLGIPTSDDFSDTENSSSTEKKHFIGKIKHYYPKPQVATIKLVSNLQIRDKINIIGNTTGINETIVESMEINNKPIKKADKGQEVGIKVNLGNSRTNKRLRKNDEVYVIINSNKN